MTLDWRWVCRFALGTLGWEPRTFWQATPNEFLLAIEGRYPEAIRAGGEANPLDRGELRALMRCFPDH